jgi:hypothetical protein
MSMSYGDSGARGKAVLRGILPDNCISRLLQPNFADMSGAEIFLLQGLNEMMGEILIEEELTTGESTQVFAPGQLQMLNRHECLRV